MVTKVTFVAILLIIFTSLLGFWVNPDNPKIIVRFTIAGLVLAMVLVFFVALHGIKKASHPTREDNKVP